MWGDILKNVNVVAAVKAMVKGKSELTNVLEIPIDFASDCEVTGYDFLNVMKYVSLIYIAKFEQVLQSHGIELPDPGLCS